MAAESSASTDSDVLYKCEPDYWKNKLNKPMRMIAGYVVALLFVASFIGIVWLSFFILLPCFYYTKFTVYMSSACVGILVASMLAPSKEWPLFRTVGQLFYELFSVSTNLSPEQRRKMVELGTTGGQQFIIAMYPHGVFPFQSLLWAAYCDQYLTIDGKALYGFGAAADVTLYLPLLRNVMTWLTAGGASYKTLKAGISKGIAQAANAMGRTPRHLYILPGGVAEIHTSMPGKNVIVFKNRHGIMRLSLETGAAIVPSYVFGGTDFFHSLSTDPRFKSIAALSRKLKMGLTLFWGPFWLPIPYIPRLTMVFGDPIYPPQDWPGKDRGESCPQATIDELHEKVLQEIQRIFNQYKKAAGQPDAVLEVV